MAMAVAQLRAVFFFFSSSSSSGLLSRLGLLVDLSLLILNEAVSRCVPLWKSVGKLCSSWPFLSIGQGVCRDIETERDSSRAAISYLYILSGIGDEATLRWSMTPFFSFFVVAYPGRRWEPNWLDSEAQLR